MKTLITLIALSLINVPAQADQIVTSSLLMPLQRAFTRCVECEEMENLRTQIFLPAQKDRRLRKRARAEMAKLYKIGDELGDEAARSGNASSDPHFVNKVNSYYRLAPDAFQFDEDSQIEVKIAYLNHRLGRRDLFLEVLKDEVLNRPENKCRRNVFERSVQYEECRLTKSKDPTIKCTTPNDDVERCEARRAMSP